MPTLDALRWEYELYCAALPQGAAAEDFTTYVFRTLQQAVMAREYVIALLEEQNRALQEDRWTELIWRLARGDSHEA